MRLLQISSYCNNMTCVFSYLCPQSKANETFGTPGRIGGGGWYRVCPPPNFDPIHWMFTKFYVSDLLSDATFEPYY